MMKMMTKTHDMKEEDELEVRPGGMLVQKRDPDETQTRVPPPTIRVRVKYGSVYHEIIIKSTATFGELKKMLTGPTGLHHEDQKIIYKNKERSSKVFLDVVGVKDRSKMVVLEDLVSKERRSVEARKNAKIAKDVKLIADISLEVDRLAGRVLALDLVISKGDKVDDKKISELIELLMNQVLKLDEIKVVGDVNDQKKMQVKKVQRCVETLDVLKKRNSDVNKGKDNHVPKQPPPPQSRKFAPKAEAAAQQKKTESKNTSKGVVVTTQWETFDSLPTVLPDPPSTSTTVELIQPNFNWDLL